MMTNVSRVSMLNIFVFAMLAGCSFQSESNPCVEELKLSKQDSSFSINSGQCTEYKKTIRIPNHEGMMIEVKTTRRDIGKYTYIETADYVVEDGNERIVKRSRLMHNSSEEYFWWFSSENCSVLIFFHKQRNDGAMLREDHLEASVSQEMYKPVTCHYPWQSFTGSREITRHIVSFIGHICAVEVDVPIGHNIRGHIKEAGEGVSIAIYNTDTIFDTIPLLTWSWNDGLPSKPFLSKFNSITIVYDVKGEGVDFRIPLEEHIKDCSCFPSLYSLPIDGSPVVLTTPDYPKGECENVVCQTSISTNAVVTRGNNYHVKFSLDRYVEALNNTVEFNVEGAKMDFKMFGKLLEREFDFSNIKPIIFTYKSAPKHSEVAGLNMTMAAVHVTPDCVCPTPRYEVLLLEIPRSCPRLDCIWTLIKSAEYAIEVDFKVALANFEKLTIVIIGKEDKEDIRHHQFVGNGEETRHISSLNVEKGESVKVWYDRNIRTGDVAIDTHLAIHYDKKDCDCKDGDITLQTNDHHTFASPNWPRPYCNNLDCRYKFIAPPKYIIKLQIHNFSMENNNDFLFIFDGVNITGKEPDSLTGANTEHKNLFASTGNVLSVVFRTDWRKTESGFRATIYTEHEPSSSVAWLVFIILFLSIAISSAGIFLYRRHFNQQLSSRWVSFANNQFGNVMMH